MLARHGSCSLDVRDDGGILTDLRSSGDAAAKDAAAKQVTALADAYVRDYLEAFPYQALVLGAPEVHPDRLADHSLPALKKWEDREDQLLSDLKKIELKLIDGRSEATTYKFLQNQLESAREFRVCRSELWNVSPTWTGWQADLPDRERLRKPDQRK